MIDTMLLNEFWQGAFIVAIAAVTTAFLPQRHAATRYAIWFAALFALATIPLISLLHASPALGVFPASVQETAAAPSLATAKAAAMSGSWLTGIWLAGVAFFLTRLAVSYTRINRIVRTAIPRPDLGSGVATSADIAIPIAAGLFSPAIVIPAHLAAALEPRDLASIVQHERAHIRRMDIAGNAVQRLVEALLFFSPWVYIVGRQLLKEREAACDDWAVHASGDPDRYASCLAQLARDTQNARAPLLTPSAIGSNHILVGRIARLLNRKGIQLHVNYVILGGTIMLFGVLAMLLQTTNGLASAGGNVVASCAVTSVDVHVINAAEPRIPKSAYRPDTSADALVTVAADGHLVNVTIRKSSGNKLFDEAVVTAAKNSTYSPKTVACTPVTGQYVFKVQTGH